MSSIRWRLGDVFILRHAGFPFDWLESLGWSAHILELADRVLDAEEQLLAASRLSGKGNAHHVMEAVRLGNESALRLSAQKDWAPLMMTWQKARQQLETACTAELERLRERLHTLAMDRRIQEAAFLSNPSVYENMWQRYVASPSRPDNTYWRRIERQIYTYLQRFCAKNETTSFFGPMGYGEIVEGGSFDVSLLPDRRRRTFLSYWAVNELAHAVNRERELRLHLPVRCNPLFSIQANLAKSSALNVEFPLDSQAMQLLDVLAAPHLSLTAASAALGSSVAQVERIAAPLLRAGVLLRGISIPSDIFDTLEALLTAVKTLPDGAARSGWLARLEQLRNLLTAFEGANFDDRRALFQSIEHLFTEYTGKPARRGEGHIYADRLVIYEEASSQFAIRISRRLAERLAQSLSGGLELSAAYGEHVQRNFRRSVLEVVGQQQITLDLLSYAMRARPGGTVESQFSPLPPVDIPTDQASRLALPADLCGVPGLEARYALADVCIAASSLATLQPGAFRVVLSRVHHHLLLWSWLCAFYPDRRKFETVALSWLEQQSTTPLVGLEIGRRNKGFYCFPGTRVALPNAGTFDSPHDVLSATDLIVRMSGEGPALYDPNGQSLRLYLPLADYTTYPPFAALAHPLLLHAQLQSDGNHTPRIQVGEAIYQRERWKTNLDYLTRLHGIDLLLAVQREKRAQQWPRFLFARISSERKPYLIDTLSPFGHDLLRHLVRGGTAILLEEMLPGPEDLWLRDEQGKYTCELRMQVERPKRRSYE